MITPQEKAIELLYSFMPYSNDEYHECAHQWELKEARIRNAKQCALIAVDEILKEIPTDILYTYKGETKFIENDRHQYYQQVKTEIEKL